jgi:hypothetical protein
MNDNKPGFTLNDDEALYVHEVLSTQGLSLPLSDAKKLITAGTVKARLDEWIASISTKRNPPGK